MPRAARRESASGIYHVLTRGSGQQLIFEDDCDRRVFINLMVKVFGKYEVEVFAWCLMENHVHVLLRAAFDDLSRSIAEIKSRYAQYFNEQHERSGSLFQSRFQSENEIR